MVFVRREAPRFLATPDLLFESNRKYQSKGLPFYTPGEHTAIYRAASGVWWIRPSSTGMPYAVGFGGHPSDMPVNPAVIHLY